MRKVLIVSHAMEIGGAEKALLGLLSSFDLTEFSVDLFLMRHEGELMQYIPKGINLLPENKKYASLAVPFSKVLKNRAFGVGLGRFTGNKKAQQFISSHHFEDSLYVYINYSHKYTEKFMPQISEQEYDIAISFLTPHYFVAHKCRAKKKIAWIHTDYSSIELDTASELKMWEPFDNIISISDNVTKSFVKIYPSLKEKIVKIENIHCAELIKAQSEEFSVKDEMPDDGFIKFLSVGRYCHAKNFDNVPQICSLLPEVKWYIIGFGPDEELIKQKIIDAGMQDRVILLGKKANPYPYFKACDFYIQPSRYEGNAVTVNEALILGKKVAIADYSTSASQIHNGVDGVIVPQDNEGCAAGLAEFISNKELQEKIINNVRNTDFSKSGEFKKLAALLKD